MDDFARPLTVLETRSSITRLLNSSTILERVRTALYDMFAPLTGYTIKRVSEIRGKTVQN